MSEFTKTKLEDLCAEYGTYNDPKSQLIHDLAHELLSERSEVNLLRDELHILEERIGKVSNIDPEINELINEHFEDLL